MEDTENSISGDADIKKIDVERDPNFTRFMIDQSLVFNLGRDFELSFLQAGPKIISREERSEDRIGFALNPVLTEVARARISPYDATQLLMLLLSDLMKRPEFDREAFQQSVKEMLETILVEDDDE